MKKQIAVGVGILFLVSIVFFGYRTMTTPPKSPKATVTFSQGGLEIQVVYSRPSKRNRLIFGEKAAGALVPYGQYWRLGANAATEISFSKNVFFAGKPLSAGTYRMYAIPMATTWQIVLNSAVGKSGAFEPNHEKDILSVNVPVALAPNEIEQFTIQITSEENATKLALSWDHTLVQIPVMAN